MDTKSRSFLFCCLIVGLTAISQKAFAQSSVVDEHFKALNKHDVNAVVDGYDHDADISSPNWEGVKTGADAITEVYKRYFASTPDLAYKVNNIINAGDNIIVEYTTSGTLSQPESGTPEYMRGKKYSLNYCAILTVKRGKITNERDYFDQVAFLRQVGFFDQH